MKKISLVVLLFLGFALSNAQYAVLNEILNQLEEKKGINQEPLKISIEGKKFIYIKEFEDHTERDFVIINGEKATYVEVFDDKATGDTSSNVFAGDVVRSNKNIISLRCDVLEGQKIPIPLTKTFFLTKQKDIIYLVDTATRERWIDEKSFSRNKK